jgi:hypothetical protein
MRSREETLDRIDDKLFGVYVRSGGSTGAGCALLAQRNGSMTALIETRKLSGSTPKVGSEVDNGKSELERRGERHGVRFGACCRLDIKLSPVAVSSILIFTASWKKWFCVLRHHKGFGLFDSVRFGLWLGARRSRSYARPGTRG